MLIGSARGKSAHLALALLIAGLGTSTAGRAVTPAQAAQAIIVEEETEEEVPAAAKHVGEGEASYYGNELAGNRTASGERFNPRALTAAHRTLPLGSKLRVTNQANGRSVIVRINDRGPFAKSRLIDVSYAAAQQINMIRAGKARVRLELLAS
jgi:rare lipoprotein A